MCERFGRLEKVENGLMSVKSAECVRDETWSFQKLNYTSLFDQLPIMIQLLMDFVT